MKPVVRLCLVVAPLLEGLCHAAHDNLDLGVQDKANQKVNARTSRTESPVVDPRG